MRTCRSEPAAAMGHGGFLSKRAGGGGVWLMGAGVAATIMATQQVGPVPPASASARRPDGDHVRITWTPACSICVIRRHREPARQHGDIHPPSERAASTIACRRSSRYLLFCLRFVLEWYGYTPVSVGTQGSYRASPPLIMALAPPNVQNARASLMINSVGTSTRRGLNTAGIDTAAGWGEGSPRMSEQPWFAVRVCPYHFVFVDMVLPGMHPCPTAARSPR